MRRLIILFIILFLSTGLRNIYAEEKMTIEIIPLGPIDNFVLDYLKNNLGNIFATEVYISESGPLPEYAYNKKRGQYLSSRIIDNLSRPKKNSRQKAILIINKDLYIPELNFVFGKADPVKGICIISITRLEQSYYGLLPDQDKLLKRTLKEAVHEIGHLLYLAHCPNPKCVMHFSNTLQDTDRKDYHFCDNCRKHLF